MGGSEVGIVFQPYRVVFIHLDFGRKIKVMNDFWIRVVVFEGISILEFVG